MKKTSVLSAFLFFSLHLCFGLDLVEINSTLADAFESFTDKYEGQTSFRSLNIPSGGRVESLGTAFTGLCDDIGFFDYNPAASAILEQTETAVYHNSWIADSAMETLCATGRSGNLGYGAQLKCFYVPFSEYSLYGEKVAGGYYSETSAAFNLAKNFRAGYTFKGVSLGLNAKLAWRNMPDYTDNQTGKVMESSGLSQSALAVMADTGLIMSFNLLKNFPDRNPNLRFGLAFTNLGAAFTGFGNSIQLDDPVSTRAAFGFSYRPVQRLLLTGEIRKPLNLLSISESASLALASGLEFTIVQGFSFAGGFLVQGGNPRISFGSEFEYKQLKLDVNYTFDLTSSTNPVNHLSLSAKLKFGDKGRKKALEKVDKEYIAGLKLYAEGDYTEAILKWNEAIKLASEAPLFIRYEPAIDARNSAITFNKNKADLQNVQNFSED